MSRSYNMSLDALCRKRLVAVFVLFVCGLGLAAPVAAAEFEIPLQDLKSVQKKPATKKSEGRKRKAKKESAAGEGTAPAGVPAAGKAPATEATQPASADPPDNSIAHSPYSFIVAGKRTRLSAVINSSEPIQAVRCQYRSNPAASFEDAPMALAEKSQFTYTVQLPALAGDATALQYRFVVTDQAGRVTRSPEYSIPLRATAVVPGWQE